MVQDTIQEGNLNGVGVGHPDMPKDELVWKTILAEQRDVTRAQKEKECL